MEGYVYSLLHDINDLEHDCCQISKIYFITISTNKPEKWS